MFTDEDLDALNFSGKRISLATLLGILFGLEYRPLMISAEEKTSVVAVLSFGDRNTRGGTVEVLSVFIVQRKILLLFQNFEVKIHLKPFSFKK